MNTFNSTATPSELPKGTIIEIQDRYGNKNRYERSLSWVPLDDGPILTLVDVDVIRYVRIISVPYAVTLKLAEWLDNVYTKTGRPEDLIIEAAVDAAKTKHDSHIPDRPKKG